uniref:Cupin-like domain-containing protein n=1 Tax=Opuntia streptacantha TaxID=393608 RepID=A0A7C9AKX3_OPUST
MEVEELKKGLKIGGKIERVNGKELSYTEFVERYLAKNQPVVVTGIMEDWRACKDWVDLNGHPNLRFFSTHFGKSKVQVADCGSREFTDQRTVEMSVSDFIEYWVTLNEENKAVYHSVAGDYSDTTNHYDGKPRLYLKDWHFVKEHPEYVAYSTPLFFKDDWLNLYLDDYHMHSDPDYQEQNEVSCSDYRFVYMGPKGWSLVQ